jgi:hypothetical protein
MSKREKSEETLLAPLYASHPGRSGQWLTVAEERLGELKAQLEDMREQRNRWQDACTRAQQALPGPKPDDKPMTWWRWLRSTG